MEQEGAAPTMRAAVYRRFGGPDVVRIERVRKPKPGSGEVLVKVHASTVSAADHRTRTKDVPGGLGLLSSLTIGFFRPRIAVLGMDVAGVVEAVGAEVTGLRPGDEVIAMLGAKFGGHAEYVCVPQDGAITVKPRNMDFEEAVTLVFGGITARAFLNAAPLRPGAGVLINGASGAVGTAAVQLAKQAGAHVTAVCSGRNAELVRSLGADRVIDYTEHDLLAESATYDIVMDCVGYAPYARLESLVRPGGALLQVIADLKGLLLASARGRRSGKRVVATPGRHHAEDLAHLVQLAEAGRFHAAIDRTHELDDIAAAHRYVDSGRKRGSVVVRIASHASVTDRTAARSEIPANR
jgi:NADPH:quinone reductase-like Zn-dependent oxidoreductase